MKTTIVSGNNIMRPGTADQNEKAENLHSAVTPVVMAEKQRMVATEKRCAVERRPITYGYIRVSTREQNEARQLDAMKNFGVDQMVMDKQSGKDFDRPAYYMAETERTFIKQRQAEGIAAAKALGQKFGRPCKERGEKYESLLIQWREGKISANEAGRQLGVTHKSFLRWARENDQKIS